ncbi:hypothetical protein CR513_09890, partial [Mucuna pruriens]
MDYIKVQALASFITKLAPVDQGNSNRKERFLSVDKASNQRGNRESVILEGLNEASNNQAEYEALLLLTRMKLARDLGGQILTAKSDSKLVND